MRRSGLSPSERSEEPAGSTFVGRKVSRALAECNICVTSGILYRCALARARRRLFLRSVPSIPRSSVSAIYIRTESFLRDLSKNVYSFRFLSVFDTRALRFSESEASPPSLASRESETRESDFLDAPRRVRDSNSDDRGRLVTHGGAGRARRSLSRLETRLIKFSAALKPRYCPVISSRMQESYRAVEGWSVKRSIEFYIGYEPGGTLRIPFGFASSEREIHRGVKTRATLSRSEPIEFIFIVTKKIQILFIRAGQLGREDRRVTRKQEGGRLRNRGRLVFVKRTIVFRRRLNFHRTDGDDINFSP